MIENIPGHFILKTNHTYPPYNNIIFEEYFYHYMVNNKIQTKRNYIPILWTNLYLSRGNGSGNMSDIQQFLDSLDRSKKYFTVLQYDDGILQDLKDLDIQVFCAGGGGQKDISDRNLGYPIPLITQPGPVNLNKERNIFCSFIGIIQGRHRIREKISQLYGRTSGFVITEKTGYNSFVDIMERSIFSLSPRGYGATSFRICESLQHGSIPVYIYDKDWTPWPDEFDFNKIGIKIHESEIPDLEKILRSKTKDDIDLFLNHGKEIYKEYFSFEGCAKKIIEKS